MQIVAMQPFWSQFKVNETLGICHWAPFLSDDNPLRFTCALMQALTEPIKLLASGVPTERSAERDQCSIVALRYLLTPSDFAISADTKISAS